MFNNASIRCIIRCDCKVLTDCELTQPSVIFAVQCGDWKTF